MAPMQCANGGARVWIAQGRRMRVNVRTPCVCVFRCLVLMTVVWLCACVRAVGARSCGLRGLHGLRDATRVRLCAKRTCGYVRCMRADVRAKGSRDRCVCVRAGASGQAFVPTQVREYELASGRLRVNIF